MLKLEHNTVLDRMLRTDDLSTLGVSTQTLAEEAILAGRTEEAIALVDYFHQEMRIMHSIMITWLTDISRYLIARGAAAEDVGEVATTLFDIWRTYPMGEGPRQQCQAAIRQAAGAGEASETPEAWRQRAVDLLDAMRLEFKVPHDILVAWVQNLLSGIAARWGEETVLESILHTHQSIWGDRYTSWHQLTPHQRLALTVEGMRGGHFSGERRRGDMTMIDQGDRYKMVMELCGSGGVLRRGDPESGRPPHPVGEHGVNREAHLWTWQKTGIHWYCSHCAIAMEWLPGRQRGRLLRPLDHVMDPAAPCTWYIYKDEEQTRVYHYPRTGVEPLPGAPDHGENSQAEYPGGS